MLFSQPVVSLSHLAPPLGIACVSSTMCSSPKSRTALLLLLSLTQTLLLWMLSWHALCALVCAWAAPSRPKSCSPAPTLCGGVGLISLRQDYAQISALHLTRSMNDLGDLGVITRSILSSQLDASGHFPVPISLSPLARTIPTHFRCACCPLCMTLALRSIATPPWVFAPSLVTPCGPLLPTRVRRPLLCILHSTPCCAPSGLWAWSLFLPYLPTAALAQCSSTVRHLTQPSLVVSPTGPCGLPDWRLTASPFTLTAPLMP